MTLKRSLRVHLLFLYVMLAVLSGVIVPMVGMSMTFSEFKGYLQERKKYDIDDLGNSLISLYQEDGAWDDKRVMDVLRQASRIPMMSLALYDAEGAKVFPTRGAARHVMHDLKSLEVRNQMELPSGRDSSGTAFLKNGVNRIDLRSYGKPIGSLVVTMPTMPGKIEMMFVKRLGQHTVIGAVLMIVLACVLGFFVASELSRPVLKAAERARRISRGEYEITPDKASGIKEMDALSESVAELGRSLAGQESLRKRLMIDVAHELRTPLTVVKSQIEALVDGVWDASPERLNLCVAEIDRLSHLIAEVEQLANLEGEILILQTEPVDLGAWLGNVLDSFDRLFGESAIELTRQLPEGVFVEIDTGRFRHAIENILANSLRYTSKGGKVDVGLKVSASTARIEIKDTGTGIKSADLPHVFDRFYRADTARTRRTGGRGVGLAIAKAAVEAHGGMISVESEDGKGSLFTIVLPKK